MEWFKKWLTDGFTKVPLLSISVNLKFFKKYGSKYSCTCRVNKLFKNDWYIKRTMEDKKNIRYYLRCIRSFISLILLMFVPILNISGVIIIFQMIRMSKDEFMDW